MKKTAVRLIACIVSAALAAGLLPIAAFASGTNGKLSIPFTVQERSGVEVKDYFFRRGVAIEEGLLYSADNICLTEDGKPVVSDAESLETYDDGSIKWLLVSGKVDLKPNEYKRMVITNGTPPERKTTYTKTHDRLTVHSEKIDMTVGMNGIESLRYNGTEQLSGGINLYVTADGKTDYMQITDFEVLKHTDSYIKLDVKGPVRKDITGQMYITIAEGASKLQIDHRITVTNHIDIESVGLTIGAPCDGKTENGIVDSDFLDMGSMQLATYDDTRFNGSIEDASKTGYVIRENSVDFSPLNNGKSFTWYDGMSRTCHLHICFGGDGENWTKTLAYPPNAKADINQYVKAGLIKNTIVGGVVREFMDSMKKVFASSVGLFEAGSYRDYNAYTDKFDDFTANVVGELEYNLGYGYMQTGDEDIFSAIVNVSEIRSDIGVYRGMHKEMTGLMRYRMNVTRAKSEASGVGFWGSHSLYGDESGLYMAYVLTGDEWVYDTYKLCSQRTIEDMYARPTLGTNQVEYWYFGNASNPYRVPNKGEYLESRGMIRARSTYLASQFFHDERFKQASDAVVQWAENAQLEDGNYTQAYYHDGSLYYQAIPEGYKRQLPQKYWVNLIGFRGIAHLLYFEDSPKVLAIVKKMGDFLCGENEKFGQLLISPSGDKEKYEVDEKGDRYIDGRSTILAVDILASAFLHTDDTKYLKSMLSFLEGYIACSVGGLGNVANDIGYGAPTGFQSRIGYNFALLRISDILSQIFIDYRDEIEELGYEDLAVVFSNGTRCLGYDGDCTVEFPHVTRNTYELDGTKSMFLYCLAPEGATGTEEVWEQDVAVTYDGNRLWEGAPNVIDSAYEVTLARHMYWKDVMAAIQRPIYIDEFTGHAEADVAEYSADKIEFSMKGDFETSVRITDGKFPVKDGCGYKVDVARESGGVRITVTQGGDTYPENGAIYVAFNGSAQKISGVGMSAFGGTSLKNAEAERALSAEELKTLVKESLGCDISLKSENPTWDEFCAELTGALGASASGVLEKAGLRVIKERLENPSLTDEQAVRLGAEALTVEYKGDELSSDVYLSPVSIHGTRVEWFSDREDILDSAGTLNRDRIDCGTVTLTARVSRGNATFDRKFVIPLKQKSAFSMLSYQNYDRSVNVDELVKQTGTFELEFTATPLYDKVDGVLSISSDECVVTGNANPQFRVRFYSNGMIDSYDNDTYKAENEVPYEKDKSYRFRMVVRLDDDTFDAYVTPEGGTEIMLAKNYRRRAGTERVSSINNFWAWDSNGSGIKVEDISLHKQTKDAMTDVTVTDANGVRFAPLDTFASYAYPLISDSGKYINWFSAENSALNKYSERMTINLGYELLGRKDMTLFELLQSVRLVSERAEGSDPVTLGSLTRIWVNLK